MYMCIYIYIYMCVGYRKSNDKHNTACRTQHTESKMMRIALVQNLLCLICLMFQSSTFAFQCHVLIAHFVKTWNH